MRSVALILLCCLSQHGFAYKNFILISAPGSGKGTFSQHLVKKYGYVQICPGDMLRDEVRSQTELGKRIKPIIENGDYVDEETVCRMVAEKLISVLEEGKNFIIDGFPRSRTAFYFLHGYLSEHKVHDVCFLQILANDADCIKRIMGRQVCPNCFWVYNIFSAPSHKDNECDHCGAALDVRLADTKDLAEKRLRYFHANIEPLVEVAKKMYMYLIIDGGKSMDELRCLYEAIL